jgi:hypothetical protein
MIIEALSSDCKAIAEEPHPREGGDLEQVRLIGA